jgi:hypothetical protein
LQLENYYVREFRILDVVRDSGTTEVVDFEVEKTVSPEDLMPSSEESIGEDSFFGGICLCSSLACTVVIVKDGFPEKVLGDGG